MNLYTPGIWNNDNDSLISSNSIFSVFKKYVSADCGLIFFYMWCLTFVPVVSIRLLYRNQSTPLRFLKILKFSYLNRWWPKFFKKDSILSYVWFKYQQINLRRLIHGQWSLLSQAKFCHLGRRFWAESGRHAAWVESWCWDLSKSPPISEPLLSCLQNGSSVIQHIFTNTYLQVS